ncbi:hypothetical protein CTI12_AA167690 [Artemisia annua]|uniref:aspartyl aminopeptidase n=1 Tax=Artemisia annua TaxID=35608 RepID=A0A2U1NJW8_ARTAN|nr:hypothetical protein CTI12_AA167690 [Artemisia annua]
MNVDETQKEQQIDAEKMVEATKITLETVKSLGDVTTASEDVSTPSVTLFGVTLFERLKKKMQKPPTRKQRRNYQCDYLKNMKGYKLNSLAHIDDGKIQEMYESAKREMDKFVPMETEELAEKEKEVSSSGVKRAGVNEEEVIDAVPLSVKLPFIAVTFGFQGKTACWDIKRADGRSFFRYTVSNSLHVIDAHTDSPCLKLKPKSASSKSNYLMVNVQTYGGGLWHTCFDRDLSVAGRIIVRSGDGSFLHKLVKFIFSTATDGKITAWLYDTIGSRVDYNAPGHSSTRMAYNADGTRQECCWRFQQMENGIKMLANTNGFRLLKIMQNRAFSVASGSAVKRPLPVYIGRCSCVIVKEKSVDGLKGPSSSVWLLSIQSFAARSDHVDLPRSFLTRLRQYVTSTKLGFELTIIPSDVFHFQKFLEAHSYCSIGLYLVFSIGGCCIICFQLAFMYAAGVICVSTLKE